MLKDLLAFVVGGGPSIKDVAEVFRPNAEAKDARDAEVAKAVIAQFAGEFEHTDRRGFFDRFMDGINRLPRPLIALGAIGLLVAAMVDPVWFAARMQGVALVPDALWWIVGIVMSFYFTGRYQAKTIEFQRSVIQQASNVGNVVRNIEMIESGDFDLPAAEAVAEEAAGIRSIEPGNRALTIIRGDLRGSR